MINDKRNSLKAIPLYLLSQFSISEAAGYDLTLLKTEQAHEHSVKYPYLTINNSTTDILNHPAFNSFSSLILPWDDPERNHNIPIRNMQRLLPYHSHLEPETIVQSLNRMIDDKSRGKTIFYDIYSDKQKSESAEMKNTGLFFFRGKKDAPFAVVCPGGGFEYVGSVHEGFPYAVEINRQGFNVFVLRYRVGRGGLPAMQDLAQAISYIFNHAKSLEVSTKGYSVWGSSAGARMAAAVGSYGVASFGGDNLPKPSAVVMAYTGYSDYTEHEPATFVAVGSRDGIAPPSVMKHRVNVLRQNGTLAEYHQYEGMGHGFGVGKGTVADGWVTLATDFWRKNS